MGKPGPRENHVHGKLCPRDCPVQIPLQRKYWGDLPKVHSFASGKYRITTYILRYRYSNILHFTSKQCIPPSQLLTLACVVRFLAWIVGGLTLRGIRYWAFTDLAVSQDEFRLQWSTSVVDTGWCSFHFVAIRALTDQSARGLNRFI